MSAELLLSVVTVTYNDEVALGLTLDSCRMQWGDRRDCEFIVIDGASTDGTDGIVANYSDIVTIYQSEPDRGIYHAMNKALSIASGRYIMYLNAGDLWSDRFALQAVRSALIKSSPIWLVAGAVRFDSGGHIRDVKNIPHSWLRHALGLQAHCHQSTLILRSLIRTIGGFSEDYDFIGDFDLILRVGLVAQPAYLPRVIVTYAGGGISAVNGGRISKLQRRVRMERMQLGFFAETLNGWFMRYHSLRRSFVPFVTSARGRVNTLMMDLRA